MTNSDHHDPTDPAEPDRRELRDAVDHELTRESRLLNALQAAARQPDLSRYASESARLPPPPMPNLTSALSLANVGRHDLASDYVARIESQIDDLERSLGPGEAVGLELFFPNERTFIPYYFGYRNPDIVIVDAYDCSDDREVRLLVPKGAILLSMTKYKAGELDDLSTRPRPIGFQQRPPEDDPGA